MSIRSSTRLFTSLVLLLVFATSSCGTFVYNRAWGRFEDPGSGVGMVGRWQGTWRSDRDGHAGGLRCMLTRTSDDDYLARFHSTYGWFFFFRHTTTFHVTRQEGDLVSFEGQEDLGKMAGGVYEYRGTVVGDHFEARYEAENGDHGVFEMERLRVESPEP